MASTPAHESASVEEESVPNSAHARRQMQQYLLSLPLTPSARIPAQGNILDTVTLVEQSRLLTNQVDLLHASLTGSSSYSRSPSEYSRQWLKTVTLLNDLKRLLSRIHSVSPSIKSTSLDECRSTTQQNIGIVQALLDLVSSSASTEASPTLFTSQKTQSSSSLVPSSQSASDAQMQSLDFAFWKQKALQGLDSDANSHGSEDDTDEERTDKTSSVLDDDLTSEAESDLTDPEDQVSDRTSNSRSLGAVRKEAKPVPLEEGDFDEYGPSTQSTPAAAPNPSNPAAPTSGTASDTILQADRSTQEALSGELLRMASVLKSNSRAFADALERDRVLLEKAGNDLGQNLDLMTKTRGRLGVYSKKVRSMGWFTLGAIVIVMLSWMFMFVVIRLT